ncbi:MAG: hypothetical protein KDJ35_00825 [Alphaproteobacteria bacterium]|nr:hypothetical protein [Alphaproteobacteria bacterium]
MKRFYSWGGPGRCYDFPDAADARKTANQYGRQDTNPTSTFRFKQGPGSVFAPGARNAGDPSVEWGATRTADEISRSENFKF